MMHHMQIYLLSIYISMEQKDKNYIESAVKVIYYFLTIVVDIFFKVLKNVFHRVNPGWWVN